MGHEGTIQRYEKDDEVLLKSNLLWCLLVSVMEEYVHLQSLLLQKLCTFLAHTPHLSAMTGLQPPLCSLINGLNSPPLWISKRVECHGRGRLEVM